MADPADASHAALAVNAALAARTASGLEHEGWELPQRHAFATLLFGMASASVPSGDPEDVSDLAVTLLRQAMKTGFREATSVVDAIADALTAETPHPAVLQLVVLGRGALDALRAGDEAAFRALVLQATSSDAFASDRPLLPLAGRPRPAT